MILAEDLRTATVDWNNMMNQDVLSQEFFKGYQGFSQRMLSILLSMIMTVILSC